MRRSKSEDTCDVTSRKRSSWRRRACAVPATVSETCCMCAKKIYALTCLFVAALMWHKIDSLFHVRRLIPLNHHITFYMPSFNGVKLKRFRCRKIMRYTTNWLSAIHYREHFLYCTESKWQHTFVLMQVLLWHMHVSALRLDSQECGTKFSAWLTVIDCMPAAIHSVPTAHNAMSPILNSHLICFAA